MKQITIEQLTKGWLVVRRRGDDPLGAEMRYAADTAEQALEMVRGLLRNEIHREAQESTQDSTNPCR